jgi:hypothetical protein
MRFTIGSDPEVLLTNGVHFVSAIGKIPGTKEAPFPTSFGMIHVDNVTAELNVPPSSTLSEFETHMEEGLKGLNGYVIQHNLSISRESVGQYLEDDLKHPDANVAGCDPDVNAYTENWNCVPVLAGTKYRCAGGHIHIGMDLTPSDMSKLARLLDLLIAVPMIESDNPIRRQLYGGAGAFRPKPYGMEYRTPSNNWIFSEDTRRWVFAMVDRAVHEFKGITVPDSIEQVVNTHNVEAVPQLVASHRLAEYPNVSPNIQSWEIS